MKKIGILTFHFAHNYGAMLQAYALRKYISGLGYSCEIINYVPEKMSVAYSTKLLLNGKISLRRIFSVIKRKKQIKLFKNFMVSKLEVKDNKISDFKIIVVGSDQVWNTQLTHCDKNYFLHSVSDDVMGIGYGISIGKTEFDNHTLSLITDNACHFKKLSFREAVACRKVGCILQKECENVVDPVFLFNSSDWEKIARKPQKLKDEEFILFYMLSPDSNLVSEAIHLNETNNIPIYFIHPMCIEPPFAVKCLRNVGPEEFLWLIKNAQFVVTNSFHATAFSVIFGKKCVISHDAQLGERTRHLYSILGIKNNINGIADLDNANRERLIEQINLSKQYVEDSLRD